MSGGGGQSAPATTTQYVYSSPWQNPAYQAVALGTPNAPGPVTNLARATNQEMALWNATSSGSDPGAYWGLTNAQTTPDLLSAQRATLGTWNPPAASSSTFTNQFDPSLGRSIARVNPNPTPTFPAMAEGEATKKTAATGGIMELRKDRRKDAGRKIKEEQVKGYDSGGPLVSNAPYTLAQALQPQTAYFDPITGQSTNPYFNRSLQQVSALQTPAQFQQGTDIMNQAAAGLGKASGYTPQQVAADQYGAYQMQGPQQWNPYAASQYMNPYMEQVNRAATQLSNQNYLQQLNQLKGQGVKSGAYGGTRQALQEGQAQANQNLNLSNMYASNLANAYNSALGQFNTAQGQALQAGQANLTAAQQQQLANQQAALTAGVQNQQAGLQGQGLNLQALNQMGQMGQGLGSLGTGQNQAQLANLGAMGQAATAYQNLGQNYLNNLQTGAQNYFNFPATANAPLLNAINAQPTTGGSTTSVNKPASAFG